MGTRMRIGLWCGLGLALCVAASGCTISIQPWTKGGGTGPASPPQQPPPMVDGPNGSHYPRDLVPTSAQRPAAPGVNAEYLVRMDKKINDLEDERRALQDQVHQLKRQINERSEKMGSSVYEMEESTRQIKRVRDDLAQWQLELVEIRERIRRLEESRASLRPLIERILLEVEQGKDAGRPRGGLPSSK